MLSRSARSLIQRSVRFHESFVQTRCFADVPEALKENFKKVAPNLEAPSTPVTFLKERPEVPSTIPEKVTVNFVLPHEVPFLNKQVDSVVVPATAGQMGVLPGHVPTVAELKPGQEIARGSGYGVVSAAELEGFGDDSDEIEEDEEPHIVVPPAVNIRSGFQTDRGPPSGERVEVSKPVEKPEVARRLESSWDEDEFEGVPSGIPAAPAPPLSGSTEAPKPRPRIRRGPPKRPSKPEEFLLEGAFLVALVIYAINYYFGRRANEKIALSWAGQFVGEGSIIERNFAQIGSSEGADEPLLMKEGQTIMKFYASGRRYCEGLLATLELKYRHDLLSRLWYLVRPTRDMITIDVYMNDEGMDPFVFAVTKRKSAKAFHKEQKDLKDLASILDFSLRRKWNSDELAVIGDNREAANDLLSDVVIDQLFAEKVFDKYGASYFHSIHFTDQNEGTNRKVLRFKFYLPAPEKMTELSRLMAIIPYFIDAVGRYKLGSLARSKAEVARSKRAELAQKESDEDRDRNDALQRRAEEKRKKKMEERKLLQSRLNPEALSKLRAKERQKQMKKMAPKLKA
eukprot:jgi/Mesen1/2714/ME000168S01797